MKYHFDRDSASGGIIIILEIDDKHSFTMLLDTGATHTTIDSNVLYLNSYNLRNKIETVDVETSNGIIKVDVFEVSKLAALGLIKTKFQIQVYDFLAHGIFSNYDGLLGLDFFEKTEFCVNMKNCTIAVNYINSAK
jgi:predicted aspartyl protease